MVATMEGPAAAKKYVNDFLAADMPTRLLNYRNTLNLSDSELPNPVKYLTFEPLTLDNWPTLITLVESTGQIIRDSNEPGLDPLYQVIYQMRTYCWVRATGASEVTIARDNMTMVVRDALLDRPALRSAAVVGTECDIKVDEGTITEDFSDLTLLKGERFLAASFLSYELSLYESIGRANLGTMLTGVVNESLIEKVPNAPTLLGGTASNAQVALTWRAPTYDGGGINPISGYTIQYSTDSGTTWATVVADTASLDPIYTVTSLSNGTSYIFRVAALNADGTGAYSSSSLNAIPSAS
tara:strand:+ start:1305 stop:2195 length:891 start_codon:yes stop_codon:yes gene_type:complete